MNYWRIERMQVRHSHGNFVRNDKSNIPSSHTRMLVETIANQTIEIIRDVLQDESVMSRMNADSVQSNDIWMIVKILKNGRLFLKAAFLSANIDVHLIFFRGFLLCVESLGRREQFQGHRFVCVCSLCSIDVAEFASTYKVGRFVVDELFLPKEFRVHCLSGLEAASHARDNARFPASGCFHWTI